jgi:hypothetical protein
VPQVRNDYVLAPGQTTTVQVRFKPSRSGSRRATLLLRTNDSTVQIVGQTEPGAYYLDLYGIGKAGLDYTNLKLPTAVIDAAASAGGTSSGTIELTNSSKEAVTIANLAITGPGSAEIVQDASRPWPALPVVVAPGQTLKLAVVLSPTAASQPGVRTAQLDVTLASGESLTIGIEGYAGTRLVAVTPATLFDNQAVPVGTLARRTVTLKNTGTVTLVVQQPTITGADAADFQVEQLVRTVLDPGQVEFLEVTYAPSKQGSSQAQLELQSDATNGKQTVVMTAKGASAEQQSGGSEQKSSGVGSISGNRGVELEQSVPNPALGGMVEIGYVLAERGSVELRLYDASGKEVRVLEQGVGEAGEHIVRFDVSGLSSGSYRYRLVANGQSLTRTLIVTR